jgi:hypothetical protein
VVVADLEGFDERRKEGESVTGKQFLIPLVLELQKGECYFTLQRHNQRPLELNFSSSSTVS